MKNSKRSSPALRILLMLFLFTGLHNVNADELGCCTNPNAGLFKCTSDDTGLVFRDLRCCPSQQSSPDFYSSPQNQNGPTNYDNCKNSFFYPMQACSTVSQCTAQACCCSESGGSIKSEVQCKGTGLTFHQDIAGLAECTERCAKPQCSDNIDNDGNGCKDDKDSACTNPSVRTESGGRCLVQADACSSPGYTPKLSNLIITPVKGQKKFSLRWQDECSQTAASYEILRCKDSGCTNFAAAGTVSSNSFEDASENLLFDTPYTYQVRAHYSVQSATPSISKTASLGSLECLGQLTDANFCIQQAYYEQYKTYLTSSFQNEFSGDFQQRVASKFSAKFNRAFSCDIQNNLVPKGPSPQCTSQQFCIVTNNQPSCISKANCNNFNQNPFGMFSSQQECESGKYCFYDKSHTTINACFSCNPSMSCYDYKTESGCRNDNCRIGNCEWKGIASQIGIGVCITKTGYNCKWCEPQGTQYSENLLAYNNVFDICTKEKSDALSYGNFKCYFKDSTSKNCGGVVCSDYNSDQCSAVQIRLDENNRIVNPSQDICAINVCQSIGSRCAKNADGNTIADCETPECEADYFAPRTTALQTKNRKGVYEGISIEIYDRISADSAEALKASQDYTTYLCVEPCGLLHPYTSSTKSRRIILSGLSAFDSDTGGKILSLKEGINEIKYYSEDPSKNIEVAKKVTIEAHLNTASPRVKSVSATPGSNVSGTIYTNSQRPAFNVEFFEPATIDFARIISKDSRRTISFQASLQLSKTFTFVSPETLQNGEYTFEINAKSSEQVYMETPYSAPIIIDNAKPTLKIEPASGETYTTSPIEINLTFNEEVKIDYARLDSKDVKSEFTTTNNKKYTAKISMADGNKKLEAAAQDLAGNSVTGSSSFIVDAKPNTIILISPRFGTASSYTFDISVETENDAECRYLLNDNFEFDLMNPFEITGETLHTTLDFNEISVGDLRTHKLHVKCSDARYGTAYSVFDINVDASPPLIKSAFASPNPVAEKPSSTTLTAETDEPSVCRFSEDQQEFDSMEGKFAGFDDNSFRLINKQAITLDNEGEYSYFVSCKNKAGLSSESKQVQFKVDLSIPLIITLHTPEVQSSPKFTLAIETNKRSQCKFSETDKTVQIGELFGAPGYNHKREVISTPGRHKFYAVCKDQNLNIFSGIAIINVTIDDTSPSMLFVDDKSTLDQYPEKTCNTDRLRVKWLGKDDESGVKEYFYSILKTIGNVKILDWTKTPWHSEPENGKEWLWVEGLKLDETSQYTFSVKAKNFVDLESALKNSDGITIDTSLCRPGPSCGDGLINLDGEGCDLETFGSIKSCTQYTNFIGGTLKCSDKCELDTSGCTKMPSCGNNIIDPGESCDKDGNSIIFGSIKTCKDYDKSFTGGTLKCSDKCELDTLGCTEALLCPNAVINKGEECDGTNLGPLTGKCFDYNPSSFTGGLITCTSACKLDTSKCQGTIGSCNNDRVDIGEKCDGTKFGSIKTCKDYDKSFTGGTLKCSDKCELDTSGCAEKEKCGNKLIDSGEDCDGSNLGPLTGRCIDYSTDFTSGTIKCTGKCKLDTAGCKSQNCGNNKLDTGEPCDGTLFKDITDTKCSTYSTQFISGSIKCKSCEVSTDDCRTQPSITCGNSNMDSGELCDPDENSPIFGLYINECTDYTNFIGGTLGCGTDCKPDTTNCIRQEHCGDGTINSGEHCDRKKSGEIIFGKADSCQDLDFASGQISCGSNCLLDTSKCVPKQKCGNRVIDSGEECDGTNLGILDTDKCEKYSQHFFTGGTLKCSNCKLDTSGCFGVVGGCGNNILNVGEKCDGAQYGVIDDCVEFGFESGSLTCNKCSLDTSKCVPKQNCGNGAIDQGESCDGTNIGNITSSCQDYSQYFSTGLLSCDSKCRLNTFECVQQPLCGNGFIDSDEECDGANFGALTDSCKDFRQQDFAAGKLKCTDKCKIETSGCIRSKECNNGFIEEGESCDNNNFGSVKDLRCAAYKNIFIGGNISCRSCQIATDDCIPAPQAACQDGAVNQLSEECDKDDLKGKTCKSLGYSVGTLKCTSGCIYDTSECSNATSPFCGDSVVQKPNSAGFNEQCDKSDLGWKSCTSFEAYSSGTLGCRTDCSFNYTKCVLKEVPKCQDGAVNQLTEECDKEDLKGNTCQVFGYSSGTLKCTSACKLDKSDCTTPPVVPKICGDSTVQKPNDGKINEQCDKTNLDGKTCASFEAYSSGTLACNNGCTFDYSSCTPKDPPTKCQDGAVNQLSEECDKDDIKGKTCQLFGYTNGNLKCTNNCLYNTSECANPLSKICGDSILQKPNSGNINEQCDRANLDGKTCASFEAYSSGTLGCRTDCIFNYTKCNLKDAPRCQDGVVNQISEDCDKQDLNGKTCQTQGFSGGTLKCTSQCRLDTSECTNVVPKICGDSILQKPNSGNINEQCDRANLDGKTCASFEAYSSGTLACNDGCTFDYRECAPKTIPRCGDNLLNQPNESCDGSSFGSIDSCTDYISFAGGSLTCNSKCELDTSKCILKIQCGDGKLDPGERCDDKGPVFGKLNSCLQYTNFIGGDLKCSGCNISTTNCAAQEFCGDGKINRKEHCDTKGQIFGEIDSCQDLDFASGQISCGSNCLLDTSKCVPKSPCGNGVIDASEECDGINIGPLSGQCSQYSNDFTGGALKCSSQCKLDTSGCFGVVGECGDGIVSIGESCDGTKFGSINDCKSYEDFAGGMINCTARCQLDTAKCIRKPLCPNKLIDAGESCDGTNFGAANQSCPSYSRFFRSGTISCGSDCRLDTSGCEESDTCGNSLLDAGEECDSVIFRNITDTSCSSYNKNFANGTLGCSRSCRISTIGCRSNSTTASLSCRDRGSCKLNEPCSDSSDCESRYCASGKCSAPSCSDNIKNQNETGVDCGGACGKCQNEKACTANSGCQSNFCSFGICKNIESCSDGKLSPGESDADCGGACPAKCSEGDNCDAPEDCRDGLQCEASVCKKTSLQENESASSGIDTDGDGMPDEWEIENGLDPNDPSDGELDPDKDGLTNFEEYSVQSTYGRSTDPNSADTDNDGASDKREIDQKTSPVDPDEFPKSSIVKIILFILGAIILLSGFGYLGYTAVTRRKAEERAFEIPRQREVQAARSAPQQPIRQASKKQKMEEIQIKEQLKRKEEQKNIEMKKLFGAFSEEKPKQKEPEDYMPSEKQASIQKTKPQKHAAAAKPAKDTGAKKRKAPRSAPKKSKRDKGDVFARLKQITKEGKKGK